MICLNNKMLNKDFIDLSYYQVMSLMYVIDKFKKDDNKFCDGISKQFESYVIKRTEVISRYSLIKRSSSKYTISMSMLRYLTNLTGIDVLDKTTLKKYTLLVKEFERDLMNRTMAQLDSLVDKYKQKVKK